MDPAPSVTPTPSSNVVIPVDYEMLTAPNYNVDLQGSGTFTAHSNGSYGFTGRRRGAASSETENLFFTAADIANVGMSGRVVWFTTKKGRAGASGTPFVFICRDEAQAIEAARLLPTHVDEQFTAARAFQERLRALPGARHPLAAVTNLIIGVNVIVFVVMAVFLNAGLVSVTDTTAYLHYGANHGALTTDDEWWRLGASMFMHYGIIHLFLNMWALFQAGHLVERLQGRIAYAATYLASGVAGGLVSLVWHGHKPVLSAGASGAVFGVYGAMLGFMLREKQAIPRSVFDPMLKSTLTFAGYNLLFGMVNSGIDNAAHVGGFAGGVAFGWLTAMPLDATQRARLLGARLGLAAVAFAGMVAIGIAATPRFEYSLRDELKWAEATEVFAEKEKELVARQNAELARWQKSADNAVAFTRLIEEELVPFYRDFGRRIEALNLKSGRATAVRRDLHARYIAARIANYPHLLLALKNRDQRELAAYEAAEAQALQAILSSQPPNK